MTASAAVVSRQYRVARSGHTTGVVVVPWRSHVVTIMVLPKFWRAPSIAVLDLAGPIPPVIVVRETGRLVIRGTETGIAEFARSLAQCEEPPDDDDATGEESGSGLFCLEPGGDAAVPDEVDVPEGALAEFWSLALRYQGRQVLWDGSRRALESQEELTAYLTRTGLTSVPDLYQAMCRLFVLQCAKVLRSRPPALTSEVTFGLYPRGRVLVEDLPRRSRRITPVIACESGTLAHDDPWSRLILCALRAVSTSARVHAPVRRSATTMVRSMREVRQSSPQEAWNDVRGRPVPRKFRRLAIVGRLAEAILRRDYAFGDLETSGRAGVTATLLVRSSRLYECIIRDAVERAGSRVVEGRRYGIWRERLTAKAPDLLILDQAGTPVLVIDAKYKFLSSMDSMSMTDQYQQFAYAAVVGAPALFCYGATPATAARLPLCEVRTANTQAQHLLGCIGVDFPGLEALRDGSWLAAAADQSGSGMARVLAGDASLPEVQGSA